MHACAQPRRQSGQIENLSWIDDRLTHAYAALHRAGHAHSIEAWLKPATIHHSAQSTIPRQSQQNHNDQKPPHISGGAILVGGLYGVHLGTAFFGESMFCRPALGGTDASKVCLVHLVAHLRRRAFQLLDTQFVNDHLVQFGCIEIPRDEYLARLERAVTTPASWTPFVSRSTDADP